MQKLRAYLQLVRLPAVFTAFADIFLGHLLKSRALEDLLDVESFAELMSDHREVIVNFCLLLLSSGTLYLAGMVFNDVFDRKRDAAERPQRPIPSGRVSLKNAVLLGSGLMICGITTAALVTEQSLLIAIYLALCILAYDSFLKRTPLGPIAMGGCRFLNVLLGASALDDRPLLVWAPPQTLVAAALAIYIVGVTWFARNEAGHSKRWQLVVSACVLNVGLLMMFGLIFGIPQFLEWFWRGQPNPLNVALILVAIVFTIERRLFVAIRQPEPATIQPAVKTMVLSVIMLDATLMLMQTGTSSLPVYSLIVAAMLLPALWLGRIIFVT